MPSVDMPLEELRVYKPALTRQPDFEQYWKETLDESAAQPLNAALTPVDLPLKGLECYSVRFDGFGGGRIAGWYVRPKGAGRFPGICVYHGYSGRGTQLLDLATYAYQGICVLSMDCRGQNGLSQDTAVYEGGHTAGWKALGVRSPKTYYYRYVFADAVRALEVLAQRDEVDASRLAVTGISQGGGITLGVAALSSRPILAMPDIPGMCNYRRLAELAPGGPYSEITEFVKAFPDQHENVFRTMSYCEGMNLAPNIKCRTMVLCCLWDDLCLPSTIFSAYNHITATKEIEVYPYHKHEVPYEHRERQMKLVAEVLRP